MSETNLSRRVLMGAGIAAAAAAAAQRANAMPGWSGSVLNRPPFQPFFSRAADFDRSLDTAYEFLNAMMDAYASGSTLRLIQSYSDQSGLLSTAFTYDNALAVHAYLARGLSEDVARAKVLGNSLLYAQAHNFPVADGRFGQGYFVNVPDTNGAYITPAAGNFYFYTSSVGDQAWAGLALAQLYKVTGNSSYLAGAIKVANWIVANNYSSDVGPAGGGFLWGAAINGYNQSEPSGNGKSTEHNIDCYGFFSMLVQLTSTKAVNGMGWAALANHALTFVQEMFNSSGGFFYVGSNAGQPTISTSPIAEDCQTWSYLALLSEHYGVSIDWVLTHLLTTDTPSNPKTALTGNIAVTGLDFTTASLLGFGYDPAAVWLEGTSHTIAALVQRQRPADPNNPLDKGDIATAVWLAENCRLVQQKVGQGQTVNSMVLAQGGLVSATGTMDTGFNYQYFPYLHIGATGWYAVALRGADPYKLGYHEV